MTYTGEAIRMLREKAGLTARDLATLASVSESYLSRVENGLVEPSIPWVGNVTSVLSDSLIHQKKERAIAS
jgi:transcriptional regulator with XRE-family HTH domain